MLSLRFEGWAECRLATDPDPSDEPRGVSGWTFALPGEPDLDRVIRLQPDRAVRRVLGPPIGVSVRAVEIAGAPAPGHRLEGALVDLRGDPVFEGRNGIVSEDALEPIVPFALAVRSPGGIELRREHRDLATGEFVSEPPVGLDVPPDEVAAPIGGVSGADFRAARRAALVELSASTDDPLVRLGAQKRISDIDDPDNAIAESILAFGLHYRILLQGPWAEVQDSQGALGGTVELSAWLADLWFGAYDADSLCMYMNGQLQVPFQRR